MNKKQAGIILTLLALIVCAGILAARVNGPLEVTNDGYNSEGTGVFNWSKKESTSSQTDVFVAEKINRENKDAQTLAAIKAIVDDKNVAEASKADALKQYSMKTKQMDYESRIEQTLKLQGFEDVICLLEADNSKARVVVKAKELTAQQRKKIQDVVVSIANIKNVEIENKQ